jgi:peptidylprolyl isomerase
MPMKKLPKDILVLIVVMVVLVSVIVVMTVREAVTTAEAQEKPPPNIPVSEQKTVKSDSGLEYIDLRIGTGEPVKIGSKVKVIYTGVFKENGKRFDGNIGDTPLILTIGETPLIRGWTEGLQGMRKGGKRKLIVPYQLGYGVDGKRPTIPGKADLIFDIEVTDVKEPVTR